MTPRLVRYALAGTVGASIGIAGAAESVTALCVAVAALFVRVVLFSSDEAANR